MAVFEFPIGTVLAFAGTANSGQEIITPLKNQGWMLCNGGSGDQTDFEALYDVIGTAYGADGSTFYLPNYTGQFLRGVNDIKKATDGDGLTDPDAGSRTAPNPSAAIQGSHGNTVGSIQPTEMRAHTHDYTAYPITVSIQVGPNEHFAKDPTTYTSGLAGGNDITTKYSLTTENRPPNMYVYYIIKYKFVNVTADAMAGTVISYAGDASALIDGWLLCNGDTIATTNALYTTLNTTLGPAYGQSAGINCLPDYQGVFHRGIDASGTFDFEAKYRTAPRPTLSSSGNTGFNVGSFETDEFQQHTHPYTYYPNTGKIRDETVEHVLHAAETTPNFVAAGGSETRPINAAVNFLIGYYDAGKGSSAPPPATFAAPVGTVIAYAGSIDINHALPQGWLLCDGSLYATTDYPLLESVIGTSYGGRDNLFAVPDYRAKFLRGLGGIDPDLGSRTVPRPDLPIMGNEKNVVGSVQPDAFASHTHTYQSFTGAIVPDHGGGGPAQRNGSGDAKTNETSPFGGSETRPVNAYVYYLIYAGDTASD
jgi:microcystin-dependent protein